MAIGSFGLPLRAMVLVVVVGSVVCEPSLNTEDTEIVWYLCNPKIIPSGSPFFDTLSNLFVDLEQNTPLNAYNYKTSSVGSPTAYGPGICNAGLSHSDCRYCLLDLSDAIEGICNGAIGAQVQLTNCLSFATSNTASTMSNSTSPPNTLSSIIST